MAIQNTPTSKTTLFPVKTTTSSGTFGVQLNPQNANSAPNIVDQNGNVVASWNSTNKSWTPLDANATVGSDSTPIGTFLNQNSETFRLNTIRIIDQLPDNQRNSFRTSNTFSPYTTWSQTKAASTIPATPTGGDPTQTQPPTTPPETPTVDQLNNFSVGSRQGTRTDYSFGAAGGNLAYPLDRGTEQQDYIAFSIFDYGTRGLSTSNLGEFTDRKFTTRAGTVWLPIQSQISDSNSVKWNENSINAGQLEALKIFNSGVEGGVEGALTKLLSTTEQVTQNAQTNDAVKAIVTSYLAQEATGVNQLFPRLYGAILNPNVELLFEGPSLRPFNFSFKLNARSKDEADRIKKIIRFFKQGMAPQRAQTSLFLKAPHVFEIKYKFKGKDHPGLNKIKGKCALQSFNVDYTPEGTYMAYDADGTMVSYFLQMQFVELEPVYEDDYQALEDNDIGY